MWIQFILIAAMGGIGLYLIRARPSARHLALRRLGVFTVLAVGIVVVLAPGWLTAVANALGIGRGSDLLLYASIVTFLLYVVTDYKRSVQLSRANTRLARELTLVQARLDDTIAARDQGTKQ